MVTTVATMRAGADGQTRLRTSLGHPLHRLVVEENSAVVAAIISSGRDVSVDALIRFGGKAAVFQGLAGITSGQIQLSWPWRSALAGQPDTVLEWLESLSSPSLRDLELTSRFVSPKATQSRLATVWKRVQPVLPDPCLALRRFGLTLAFWEADVTSPLLAVCFQPTYDAAGSSHLEYDEWDWLREQAPSVSWYRDWDRCERLAAALVRLLEKQNASLETIFGIVSTTGRRSGRSSPSHSTTTGTRGRT